MRDVKKAEQEVDFFCIGVIGFKAPGYHGRESGVNSFMLFAGFLETITPVAHALGETMQTETAAAISGRYSAPFR